MDSASNDNNDKDNDPILTPRGDYLRYVAMDGEYPELGELARKAESLIWPASDVRDLEKDRRDWERKLTDPEREYLRRVLAFFAVSDGIVADNLVLNFATEVQINEARRFYGTQHHMENVHAEVYARFITHLIHDRAEQERVFRMVETHRATERKAGWALKWLSEKAGPDNPADLLFAKQLAAFAAVEMVFFSSSFAAPSWLRSRGLMLAFATANDQIRRDEGLHGEFAAALFGKLKVKPSHRTVWEIVTEAVQIEQEFVRSAMSTDFGHGMSRERMCQYVRFVGDFCLRKLQVPDTKETPHSGDKNPLIFMELLDAPGQTAFFERTPIDYSHMGGASGNSALHRSLNGSPTTRTKTKSKGRKGLRSSSSGVGRSALRSSSAGVPVPSSDALALEQAQGLDSDDDDTDC